jgi:enoyl-CoA hydratase
MPEELVEYSVRNRVARVEISNGKANALSPEVVAQLDGALTRAEDAGEEQVGAMLIIGAPGMFSGGFDLKIMRSSMEAASRLVTEGGTLITRMFGSDMPVVIACSGHAVAGGALMLLGADERIGASGAFRIGLIETEIGMVLPRWGADLARERLSPRELQFATVGAKMYDPEGARAVGYLDSVVEPDRLEAAGFEAAERWAKLSRRAYHGQVRVNRGDVLARLAEAVAADRGLGVDVRT